MKKVITLFLFSIVISITAQKRTNEETINFTIKSEKLLSAKGWKKNDKTGKWVENQNVIGDNEVKSFWVSHVSQNLQFLQTVVIDYNNEKYYVFLNERLSGSYKYPSIRKGWQKEKRTYFFVLNSTDYKNFKSEIELKSSENILLKSKSIGMVSDRFKILGGEHLYNEENLLAKIKKLIDKPDEYLDICYIFNSQIIDGNDIVRFRLQESCYDIKDKMKKAYFEVSLEEFKKVLIE